MENYEDIIDEEKKKQKSLVMRILRSSTIKYLLNIFDIPTIQA
jgi:hypothetical protein